MEYMDYHRTFLSEDPNKSYFVNSLFEIVEAYKDFLEEKTVSGKACRMNTFIGYADKFVKKYAPPSYPD